MSQLKRGRTKNTAPTARRSFLQVGYSGLVGLGLPGLLAARAAAATGPSTGRARSVIVILLEGGLGQHDSFDMKPEAPEGIRGEFKPIATAVPGIRICEHLPGLAARAGKLAIVRSMSHPEGNHLVAVHRVLTGQPSNPRGANDLDRVASRDDFPCYAAVLDRVRRRTDGVPSGVALPTRLVEGPLTWPGRTRASWVLVTTPGSFASTPTAPRPATIPSPCPPVSTRSGCIAADTSSFKATAPSAGDPFLDQQDAALALLSNARVGQALDLDREDPRLVDRYGRHSFGQSLLMRGGSSKLGCRSCRHPWGSSRRGTRTSPISLGCVKAFCHPSTEPCRRSWTTSRCAGCSTIPWS